MTNTRIIDLNETEVIETEDYIAVDKTGAYTYKINSGLVMLQLSEDVLSFSYGNITKTDDDNFVLNSAGYLKYGSYTLYDGLFVSGKLHSIGDATFQPNATPNIIVDGQDSKPLYNGYWYDMFIYNDELSIKGLDANTLVEGDYYVVYNETDDCWLLYNLNYESGQILNIMTQAGIDNDYEPINTRAFDGSTIDATKYPILSTIFGDAMPDMANASFGQANRDYPNSFGKIHRGFLPNPNNPQTYSINGYFSIEHPESIPINSTGCVEIEQFGTGSIKDGMTNIVGNDTVMIDASYFIKDIDKQYMGDETLSIRYGVKFLWIL